MFGYRLPSMVSGGRRGPWRRRSFTSPPAAAPRAGQFSGRATVIVAALALAATAPAGARPHISDVLAKGSVWQLNVDGESGELKLLGGRGSRDSKGGFELEFDVDWGGRPGSLKASSDPSNAVQRVQLELTHRNGIRASCSGFVGQRTDDMMAGTCGGKIPGAWYATRRQEGFTSISEQELREMHAQARECQRERAVCQGNLAARKTIEQRLQRELEASEAAKRRADASATSAKRSLSTCRGQLAAQGSTPKAKRPSEIRGRVDGQYEVGGKTDTARPIEPPSPAANSELSLWLGRHVAGLGSIVDIFYDSQDMSRFKQAVSSECGGNIYCRVAYHQQAIYLMLGGR